MPNQTILMLRVAVTLACLVGVPAVALVGIPTAEPTARSPLDHADTTRTPSVRDAERRGSPRASVGGERPLPPDAPAATPRATIRDISAAESLAEPVAPGPPTVNAAGYEQPVATSDPPAVDSMTVSLQRLQQLGAVYYRLESSPRAAAEFRFHCRVAGFERPFEAVDPVAAHAVARVVREIEAARRGFSDDVGTPRSVYAR